MMFPLSTRIEDMTMGMLGRIIGGAIGAKVLHSLATREATREGQYIPAPTSDASLPVATRSGSLVDRAGQFYAENPKLVHTAGAAALAIALAAIGKRRGLL
jgi:hypothetical protein